MEKARIEQIRILGDRLADYVSSENDRRFFYNFYTVRNYNNFRTILIKANLDFVKLGKQPFLNFDSYIDIFEEGIELARADWSLARDLVLIRMIEKLYELKWFERNIDVIPEVVKEDEDQN